MKINLRRRITYYRLKMKYEWAAYWYLKGSALAEKHGQVLNDAQQNAFFGMSLEGDGVPMYVKHESGAFTRKPQEEKQTFIQKLLQKWQYEHAVRRLLGRKGYWATLLKRMRGKMKVYVHEPIPPQYCDPFDGIEFSEPDVYEPPVEVPDTRDDVTKANDAIKEEEKNADHGRDNVVRQYTINKLAAVTLNLQKEFDNAIEELKEKENWAVIEEAMKRSAEQDRIQAALDKRNKDASNSEDDEEKLEIEEVIDELEEESREAARTAARTALNASVMASINATVLH